MSVAFRDGMRVTAQAAKMLDTNVAKVETPIGSQPSGTSEFGDALVQAGASEANVAAADTGKNEQALESSVGTPAATSSRAVNPGTTEAASGPISQANLLAAAPLMQAMMPKSVVSAGAGSTAAAGMSVTSSHADKKLVDKKTQAAPALADKSQPQVQTPLVQTAVQAANQVAVLTLPLQPSQAAGLIAVDASTPEAGSASDAVVADGKRVAVGSVLAANAGDSGRAGQSPSGIVKQQGWTKEGAELPPVGSESVAPVHEPGTAASSVEQHAAAAVTGADDRKLASHGSSAEQPSGDVGAASADKAPISPDASQGQDPAASAGDDANASLMLGLNASSVIPVVSDSSAVNPGLSNPEALAGGSVSAVGLASVARGAAKSGLSGGGTSVPKLKSAGGDADAAGQPGTASLQKAAEAAQAPASGSTGASDKADVVNAPGGIQAGSGGAGSSQTELKSAGHSTGETGSETAASPTGTNNPQSWDASGSQVVHRAQLLQAMHQSEMRMGMNSAEFGNISISAAVSHQTLSAQISLNHAELGRALTAQLPEIEKRLGSAYGLPSRVEVRDGSSMSQQGSTGRDGGGSQGGARGLSRGSQSMLPLGSASSGAATTTTYSPTAGQRLDVLV